MPTVKCSQGHTNPPGSRFCHLCGEKIRWVTAAEFEGLLLSNRYRILEEIGHGGFGRSYLAQDINRFDERCVLKEFAPQVRGTYALQKSEELFEREAGVLYRLQHPQIPRFREMLRAPLDDRQHLFLVQDYVEGQTYRQLLNERKRQGTLFTEAEVVQLLEQTLPVLRYLHSVGVIHRDISPDNLILRSSDQFPVLIDFGGVKQIAAVAASQFMTAQPVVTASTRLGKIGYAPDEQMQQGLVSSQSDLYALAMTALVLLTGQEPVELIDSDIAPYGLAQLNLSPALSNILTRMLTDFQGDRYPSAQAVLADLQGENSTELFQSLPVAQVVEAPTQPPSSGWGPGKFLAMLAVMACVLSLGAGWYTRDRWLPLVQPSPSLPPQEQARKEDLTSRSQALGVDHQFLTQLTNATFYQRYPERQGNPLSNDPAEVEWRLRWDAIANEWLTLLEQNLSTAARQRLGQYSDADRTQWRETVNQLHVGSRSLFDLTDARFFHLFPEQRGQAFIDQPIGQIWQAIATDQVNALQNGKTLQTITFGANAFNQQIQGSLAPGEGRVFIADLREGQILRLNLQSSAPQSLLSIYLPRPTQETPFLLEDSAETTWAGRLTQAGYYEIVVVSYAAEPLSYVLNVAVDNVTSSPAKSAPPPENKN